MDTPGGTGSADADALALNELCPCPTVAATTHDGLEACPVHAQSKLDHDILGPSKGQGVNHLEHTQGPVAALAPALDVWTDVHDQVMDDPASRTSYGLRQTGLPSVGGAIVTEQPVRPAS